MQMQTANKVSQGNCYAVPWGISIRIPKLIIFHLCIGSPILVSLRTRYSGWAHYGWWRKSLGRIERTFIGEPNHYDNHGNCVGYSRRTGFGCFRHFDHRGNPTGSSFCLLWILFFHARAKKKSRK